MRTRAAIISVLIIALALSLNACGWSSADQRERDEKIRDEAAKAAERAKPEIQEAAKKAGEAARTAAEEAKAAAQGVKEGWERSGHRVDLNSASEDQIASLPGMTRPDARRVIANRPYRDPHDLVEKRVLSEDTYARIRDSVIAHSGD